MQTTSTALSASSAAVGIGADAVPVGELLRRVVVHVRHADDLRVGGQLKQRVGVEIGDHAAADDAEAEFAPVVCHKNIPKINSYIRAIL